MHHNIPASRLGVFTCDSRTTKHLRDVPRDTQYIGLPLSLRECRGPAVGLHCFARRCALRAPPRGVRPTLGMPSLRHRRRRLLNHSLPHPGHRLHRPTPRKQPRPHSPGPQQHGGQLGAAANDRGRWLNNTRRRQAKRRRRRCARGSPSLVRLTARCVALVHCRAHGHGFCSALRRALLCVRCPGLGQRGPVQLQGLWDSLGLRCSLAVLSSRSCRRCLRRQLERWAQLLRCWLRYCLLRRLHHRLCRHRNCWLPGNKCVHLLCCSQRRQLAQRPCDFFGWWYCICNGSVVAGVTTWGRRDCGCLVGEMRFWVLPR
mmetsp:Transcript_25901/g.57147  ORF Transcript_25901/g.57147 Transcript_25901/m.57147 type:complete len:316 (-) Transcript_25901:44-991(-)